MVTVVVVAIPGQEGAGVSSLKWKNLKGTCSDLLHKQEQLAEALTGSKLEVGTL